MKLEVFLLCGFCPNTGTPMPLATAKTEDAAWNIGTEAADTILMAHQYSPDKQRQYAVALLASARVIPAQITFDDSYLPED